MGGRDGEEGERVGTPGHSGSQPVSLYLTCIPCQWYAGPRISAFTLSDLWVRASGPFAFNVATDTVLLTSTAFGALSVSPRFSVLSPSSSPFGSVKYF